jgi:hypothetical protein
MGGAERAAKAAADFIGEVVPKLDSNRAINPIRTAGHFLLGESGSGFRGVRNYMHGGDGVVDAVKHAYTKVGADGASHLNVGAIAGSYITASAGARVLSGGGIYKDRNGNANIIGVPFV